MPLPSDSFATLLGIAVVIFMFAAATWYLSPYLERIANPSGGRHPSSDQARRVIVAVEIAVGVVFGVLAFIAWIGS